MQSGSTEPSARPAGRRARQKQHTHREIFDAAMALFRAHGFAAVTVEQICRAADVAKGTFFLHYPSKAALLLELDRRLADELERRLAAPRSSAVAEYRTLADLFGERWLEHPDVMGSLLPAFLAPPGAGAALRSLVESIVRRGQERGEFRRNVSPRLAATLFLTTAAAVLSGAVYEEGEATPEEIRNQLLHLVLHGLLEPKPRLKWRPSQGRGA